MGGAYTIFGKQVPAHVLSLATLGSVAAIVAWPRSKKEAPAASPIQDTTTTSKEDDFDLEKFLSDLTKEDVKK